MLKTESRINRFFATNLFRTVINIYINNICRYLITTTYLFLHKTKIMINLNLEISKLEAAASKLRAISHPMRIAIIELLSVDKQLSVTQIYRKLNIEQAAASHHLNILKNKGILVAKRDGKKIFYSLRSNIITEIIDCINRCNES